MSRLIDKLTRIHQNEPQPIGFMFGKAAAEKPRMQIIACLTADNLETLSEGLNSADAALIEINKSDDISALDKVCETKNGMPGGGSLKTSSSGTLKKAINAACDFVVFPGTIPFTLTQKDKMGRILEMDTNLSEGFLRTANDLPIDAVLAFSKGEDNLLTMNRLMLFQRLVYMINKPVLVSVPDNLSDAELQAVWDIGISGVVVELADEKSIERLAELHKAIDKLAPPAFRKKVRGSAIIPRMQPEPEKPAEEEGGEEEDK